MKGNGGVMKFFSDEKNFTVECAFNRRNDRRIASSRSEVQSKMTTKQPAKVMTLCVVSIEGDLLKHFFEPSCGNSHKPILFHNGGQEIA